VVQFLGARSQEAFLKAFQKLEQFQENSKFSTWLVRIAINQSLMKLRKQRRKSEVSIDQGFQREEAVLSPEIVDQAPNPEERYRTSELRKLLIDALQELRPSLRVVFVLRDIEGLSTEQTAEAPEFEPSRSQDAALACSAAASPKVNQVLQENRRICRCRRNISTLWNKSPPRLVINLDGNITLLVARIITMCAIHAHGKAAKAEET
jgi:RNA polymerase sigma factor (sigma-70 family)